MRILGHGIDLVSIPRIRGMIDEHGGHFLKRCFTPGEAAHGEGSRRHAEHLAARFAAKEAAMKALGTGLADGILWTDIETVVSAGGAPGLVVIGRAAEISRQREISEWWVSLSHTDEHAIASVIACGGD